MKRTEVYKLIDGERDYQDNKWNHTKEQDKAHSVADWLLFIEYHLNEANHDIYMLNRNGALEEVRKIAALCVACMEYNETRGRKL
jgi:hypothetical protein